jgi:hypothetical protein
MSKAKKDIMDMIDQKASKYRELRSKCSNTKTPKKLILNFLEEADKVHSIAKNADDFYWMMEQLSQSLDEQMKIIDLGAKMQVQWNGVENWKDLRVTGVKIQWSSWYRSKHQLPDEQYIDVSVLLLEDFDD